MVTYKELHIENASSSWKLIMQSGIGLSVTVGLPLNQFMASELKLSDENQQLVDVLIIDGMPVDDPSTALVMDGTRLALAAGLPGIAGLAMKKNSAVRALRGQITHRKKQEAEPKAGRITLALYSLALPALAGLFLKKGIWITPAQFCRYASFAPDDLCVYEGRSLAAANLQEDLLSANSPEEVFFTVNSISDDGHDGH